VLLDLLLILEATLFFLHLQQLVVVTEVTRLVMAEVQAETVAMVVAEMNLLLLLQLLVKVTKVAEETPLTILAAAVVVVLVAQVKVAVLLLMVLAHKEVDLVA
jgi:hypothetical protein